MRHSIHLPKTILLALLITAGSVSHACQEARSDEVCTKETCGGDYGTRLSFVESPAVAAKKAFAEEKLVFVLHVSGHFEKSQYT
ncbi:MAG: hypothetical protein WBF93_15315 [Pirellulales bacterium]|nr:hypothetical protein [Pirellulales bacterium]